jgi:plasmid maintenance system antidote protein VapI
MRNILRRERAQAIMTAGRVSALMRERGISTASLAKSVRIQRSTLENFCAGRRIPSDLLAGIARTLETSVAYLLAISDDPAPTSAVR